MAKIALVAAVLALVYTQVRGECCTESEGVETDKFCALFNSLHHDDQKLVMQYLGDNCDKQPQDLVKEMEKRKPNFLRFGKRSSYTPEELAAYAEQQPEAEAAKRSGEKPAFLRFGRSVDEAPNFLRFGKNSEPKFLRFGRKPNFLRFGKRGDEIQEDTQFDREVRKPNFLRFGKRKPNFLRFGKRKPNFLRFGKRSEE